MSDQSLAMVLLRLVFAVVVVIGLLLLTAKMTRRLGTRGDTRDPAAIHLVSRQPLSRSASIAVVRTGAKTLVLGVTDHAVTLLSEQATESFTGPSTGPFSESSTGSFTGGARARQTHGDGSGSGAPTGTGAGAGTVGPAPGMVERLRERSIRRS